jgi:hypothetical protein
LTILEEGLISVPHRADSEKDKGVLIDGTVYGERTMASFWSNDWAGRAFFFARGSLPDECVATVGYQEEDLK